MYAALEKAGYKPNAATTNIDSAIFANKPGDGSAREQAASCQRVLGGAANFAKEYATCRYRPNQINWGMLSLPGGGTPACLNWATASTCPGVRKALLEAAGIPCRPPWLLSPDGSVKETTAWCPDRMPSAARSCRMAA